MSSNRRWTHQIPGLPDRRVNTLLVVPDGAKTWTEGKFYTVIKDGPRVFVDGPIPFADKDWTLYGQGIVTAQACGPDMTWVTFLVLWVYPFWLRWILTKVNAHAQDRAQRWAHEHAPHMLVTDRAISSARSRPGTARSRSRNWPA